MPLVPEQPDTTFKTFVYEQFSRIGKALSSPQRLIIMNVLCQGKHSVESLVRETGLTMANLSRHLQILKSAHLVHVDRVGKYMYYRLPDERTSRFFTSFRDFGAEQLAEIQSALVQIADSPSRLNPVDLEQLKHLVEEENTIVIDVRPEQEYYQAHIPGAVSIPLDQLTERLNELSKSSRVVAYCRGRFCVLADRAVTLLHENGYEARRADDGVIEWIQAGMPAATTDPSP
jgi:rhodanese-related sulfurtransferase/DNA-binding transcriptional ArsR family regulator